MKAFFFNECKRVLKKPGFLIFFGRSNSFYRWNTKVTELGFRFNEELIWDKDTASTPFNPIGRTHETIAVHSLSSKEKKAKLNKIYIDKMEFDKLSRNTYKTNNDFKQLISKIKSFKCGDEFVQWRKGDFVGFSYGKFSITTGKKQKTQDRNFSTYQSYERGKRLSTILRVPKENNYQHPTQKPTQLMSQLIQLATKPNDIILDPFMGSGSTGVACALKNRKFIGFELDLEYFNLAEKRLFEAYGN